jgi:hypothetical protein
VRLSRADLRRRINGQLSLRYEAPGLTSFAGLELIGRFLRALDFKGHLRRVQAALPGSDFGSVPMVLVVLVMLITGARRVRHVGYVEGDPLVERICGLGRMPTQHTLGRWLRAFDDRGVKALHGVNERLVGEIIDRSDLRRLTLDVDGSVVSTGLKVEGARRGFNPHRRKVPSYYPITAYEANTGQVLRVQNRAGNVHDGKASVEFLKALFAQLEETLERRHVLEMRMDGAFFRADVIDLLEAEGAEYAIKVPFYEWLGLKERVARRRCWRRVDEGIECFEQRIRVKAWSRTADGGEWCAEWASCPPHLEGGLAPPAATGGSVAALCASGVTAQGTISHRSANKLHPARSSACSRPRPPCSDERRRDAHSSGRCGGPREANGARPSSADRPRWARIRSISTGSSMLAMTFSAPPAALAALDLDGEDALQALHPGHADMLWRVPLCALGAGRGAATGRGHGPQPARRREDPVIADKMQARPRHEGGEPGESAVDACRSSTPRRARACESAR